MKRRHRGWQRELQRSHDSIADLFARSEARERSHAYLQGLLSHCERKNGWQLAEWMGEIAPYRVQHLLDRACWDADQARDRLRAYALEQLSSHDAVLIVDETGFLKKGVHSVGVKRQYTGTAGRIENSQVGVFLCYASSRGAALLDRELYLPEEWAADVERCRAAAVPEHTAFAAKPELAQRMIARALAAGTACAWVAGDEVYGNNSKLRTWLEEKQLGYVMAVACDQRMRWPDQQLRRVDAIVQSLPDLAWQRLSAGEGSKGERLYDWTMIPGWKQDGWTHGLLVRRNIGEEPEHAYYWFHAPATKASLKMLVRVAGQRWQIEQALQAAKGECGLDHYESSQLAWMVSSHHSGDARPRCVSGAQIQRRKKLPPDRYHSPFQNYATCWLSCYGADGTALNIDCTGRNGVENTNSMHSGATTASADPRCLYSIYNCSI